MRATIASFLASILFGATLLAAPAPITITTKDFISPEPATVRVTVRIERDARNLAWCLTYDGGAKYRSSCEPLDGVDAPVFFQLRLNDLPAGEYVAEAVVCRNSTCSDRSVAKVEFVVTETGDPGF
jgi:hypothetical protein